jgi:hypothetical protein
MISFGGVYTKDQFFRGIRLALHPGRRSLILRGIGVLIALAAIGAFIFSAATGEAVQTSRLVRTGIAALLLFYWALSPTIQSWRVATQQWRKSGSQMSLRGVITDEGIRSNALAPDAMDKWDYFVRAHIRPDMAVLLGVDGLATILPRNFFANESDWMSFRQMVGFKVVVPG